MTPRRSDPGRQLSSGKSLRPLDRVRGSVTFHLTRPDRGALQPLSAGPRSRLVLAAALVVTSLLSPGVRGACAGCCADGSPSVAAPLAAGIAPVHSATVAEARHDCCRHAAAAPAAPAVACCGEAAPAAAPATGGCAEPSRQPDPCGCDLGPRDETPALPIRNQPDVGTSVGLVASGFHASAFDAGRMPVAVEGGPSAVHARPLRVLYGVWRN